MSVTTITFGDVAENHVGMQKLMSPIKVDEGFTLKELQTAKRRFEREGYECTLYYLNKALPEEYSSVEDAYVLCVKNGVECLLKHRAKMRPTVKEYSLKELEEEHSSLTPDTKALMRGRVVNKRARYNLCFANDHQDSNYEVGKGTVVAFDEVLVTKSIRDTLPIFFGWKAIQLVAEGNYYYDINKCGIGFHGDGERKLVIAVRLGAEMPLYYQWYLRSSPVGERIKVNVSGGDVYCMSSKAVGTDWLRSSTLTLRHATGCDKYTTINRK